MVNRPLVPLLLSMVLLVGANCRNSPEERGEAPSAAATETPKVPSNPPPDSDPPTAQAKPADAAQQCVTNEDCTLGRFIPGECCQDCDERPVLRAEHDAKVRECADALSRCPMRNCAPTRLMRRAVCDAGTCRLGGKNLRD
ncbi:MAG: hypothetical protein M3Y59_02375 [Myxococcota bacterium]|nr:hypothetical protein [Myxococcota bacterium]